MVGASPLADFSVPVELKRDPYDSSLGMNWIHIGYSGPFRALDHEFKTSRSVRTRVDGVKYKSMTDEIGQLLVDGGSKFWKIDETPDPALNELALFLHPRARGGPRSLP